MPKQTSSSKTKTSVPKKGAPKQVAKVRNAQSPARKAGDTGQPWAPFSKKSVAFVAVAKRLAECIHDTYGDNVSIAQFERFCVAADSFSPEEKGIMHLEKDLVLLLVQYHKAKEERDTERSSFRSDIKITNVEGKLASLLTQLDTDVSGTSAKRPRSEDII